MADDKKPAMGEFESEMDDKTTSETEVGANEQASAPKTLNDALAAIAALNERIKELNAEAKKHRLRAKELEKQDEMRKAEDEKKRQAELSETERYKQQAAELEKKNSQLLEQMTRQQIRASVESHARKAGVPEENLEDVWALIDLADVEVNDDGKVVGAEEAVKALLKRKPRLTQGSDGKGGDINATNRGKGGLAVSDEQEKEIASRYGIRN
jgi:chromosome segregation ATPase